MCWGVREGGVNGSNTYYAGGNGGGAIRFVISGTLTINGTLSANGSNGTTGRTGGGSGGSIWGHHECFSLEVVSSNLTAALGSGDYPGGGGAGGRIALYYDTNTLPFDATHLQTYGGSGYQYGGPGTIFSRKMSEDANGVLRIFNQPNPSQPTPLYGVAGGSVTFDQVIVGNNATLLLVPYNNGNTNYTDDLTFVLNANNILIDSGGKIISDGQGYVGTGGDGAGVGGGKGGYWVGAGGGYGGLGGNAFDGHVGGVAYGSVTEPNVLGSAGGRVSTVVTPIMREVTVVERSRFVISGTLTINGTLSANGSNGTASRTGGGSGGSIWGHHECFALEVVSSNLTAALGSGDYPGGGGSGGRVAVYYTTSTMPLDAAQLQTFGGSGQQYGGAGTVFLQQSSGDPRGTLLVDNNTNIGQYAVLPKGQEYNFANVILSRGGNLQASAVSTNPFTFDVLTVKSDSTLLLVPYNNGNADYTDDLPFKLNATTVTVDSGGKIISDGQGYVGTGGDGAGVGGGKVAIGLGLVVGMVVWVEMPTTDTVVEWHMGQ